MKKKIISLASIMLSVVAYAQAGGGVGINTTNPKETLEVNGTVKITDLPTKGENKIYNGNSTKNATYTPAQQVVADDNGVLGVKEIDQVWFYYPTIVLPLSGEGLSSHPFSNYIEVEQYMNEQGEEKEELTIDLYEIYKQQISSEHPNLVRTSTQENLKLYAKEELEFFVIYYDNKIFSQVRFTTDKKLKYRTFANGYNEPSEHTFMNIVCRVKQ